MELANNSTNALNLRSPKKPSRKNFKNEKDYSGALANYAIELNLFFQEKGDYRLWELKKDWVRRAVQFAARYFGLDKDRYENVVKSYEHHKLIAFLLEELVKNPDDAKKKEIANKLKFSTDSSYQYEYEIIKEELNKVSREKMEAEIPLRKMTHCLKHCYTLKQWLDLKREYKEVDWSEAVEETETYVNADSLAGQACAGGACELK